MTKHNDTFSVTSDSELFCEDVFHNYLKDHLMNFDAEWQRYPNGENNPPDFNLILRDQIYAVEVTETKIIRKDRNDTVEEKTFISSRKNFVKDVQSEALKLGILKGHYCIFFLMSWTVSLNRKLKENVKKQLLKYIEKSKSEECLDPFDIKINCRIVCQIFKLNNDFNEIFASFADGAWPESQEMQNYVCNFFQYAISDKIEKLEKYAVPPPRILILFNTYYFSTPEMYKNCLLKIKNLEFFHSIFVVMSRNNRFFLYTGDEEWKNIFNVSYARNI